MAKSFPFETNLPNTWQQTSLPVFSLMLKQAKMKQWQRFPFYYAFIKIGHANELIPWFIHKCNFQGLTKQITQALPNILQLPCIQSIMPRTQLNYLLWKYSCKHNPKSLFSCTVIAILTPVLRNIYLAHMYYTHYPIWT